MDKIRPNSTINTSNNDLNKFKNDLESLGNIYYYGDNKKDEEELEKLKKKIQLETMRITATYVAQGVFDIGLLFGLMNVFSNDEVGSSVKVVLTVGLIIYNVVMGFLINRDINNLKELSDQEDELCRRLNK